MLNTMKLVNDYAEIDSIFNAFSEIWRLENLFVDMVVSDELQIPMFFVCQEDINFIFYTYQTKAKY